MTSYSSCGVIRVVLVGASTSLYFTPDCDHAIKHNGVVMTVFVADDKTKNGSSDIKLTDSLVISGDKIAINVIPPPESNQSLLTVLATTAINHTKVNISVTVADTEKQTINLEQITLPA